MTTDIEHPNIIVFFTDQQRWDTAGVHGNPLNLTPTLDDMAHRGTHLYNYFACQPVCGPARSALQTGLYPTTTGCFRNNIPLPRNVKTLAHYFHEYGYDTGYIGKWHLAERDPVPLEERGGYEYWLAANMIEFSSDAYDTLVFDTNESPVKLPGYRVDALTDAAIRFIDEHQTNPFFLFVSFLEPHHQNYLDKYWAPFGYEERYVGRWTPPDIAALGGNGQAQLGGYFGIVRKLDEALGGLIDALFSLGLLGKSVVLFSSDHGSHFKTRNDEYKRSCHDGSIRVPTALIGPGFDRGGQVRELVSSIDIAPTLLDAAHIPVPSTMQGKSLMPLLRNQKTCWPQEVFIQISESQVGRAIRTHRWKYSIVAPEKDGRRDSAANVYVEDALYDLDADPYELTNLIGVQSFAEVVQNLRDRLVKRMLEAGEQKPSIKEAPSRTLGQRRPTLNDQRRTL